MLTNEPNSGELKESPSSRLRRRRRFVKILLALVILGVVWFCLAQPTVRRGQLVRACSTADHVVLSYRMPPERTGSGDWTRGEQVTCDIVGHEKVVGLLDCIHPRASFPLQACACSTMPVIKVCRDDQVLAQLTLHHDVRLRWLDGHWLGDTRLSADSVKAIKQWIDREGGPTLKQLTDRLDAGWDQFRAAREAEWKAEEAATSSRPAESTTRPG